MRITFNIPEFTRNERNSHCDVLHITPDRVANLVLDDAIAAIKAYGAIHVVRAPDCTASCQSHVLYTPASSHPVFFVSRTNFIKILLILLIQR